MKSIVVLIAEILVRCVNFTLRATPIRAVLAAGCVMALGACGAPTEQPAAPAELIRVGTEVVTVDDFETAFSISRIAYDHQDLKQPPVWREARLRLLGQMVEEALVREQARLLGIDVGDAEAEVLRFGLSSIVRILVLQFFIIDENFFSAPNNQQTSK